MRLDMDVHHSYCYSWPAPPYSTFSILGSSTFGILLSYRSPILRNWPSCSIEANFLPLDHNYHPLSQISINSFHSSTEPDNFDTDFCRPSDTSISTSFSILVHTFNTIRFFGCSSITFLDRAREPSLLGAFFSGLATLSTRSSSSSSFK